VENADLQLIDSVLLEELQVENADIP